MSEFYFTCVFGCITPLRMIYRSRQSMCSRGTNLDHMLGKTYQNIKKNGNVFAEMDPLIDYNRFKPIIKPIYDNQGPMGRLNTDLVIMVKLLVFRQRMVLVTLSWSVGWMTG